MISVDGLTVEFGGTTLFSDISFQINEKDRIALMGKNGAGKSTLLKILAGVRQPTRGKVTAPKDCVIAYLPQHLMTEDGRTVFEEASMAFAHLREMEAEIERMNNELAVRTDYESDSYMELIEKVALMSEKFYAIDMTHFEEDVEKALDIELPEREEFNTLSGLILKMLETFSLLAVATSFLGAGLGLFDYMADLCNFDNSRRGRTLTMLVTFLPPMLGGLIWPDGFLAAISWAGLAAAIWSVIVPAMLLHVSRRKGGETLYRMPGASWAIPLLMVYGIGVAVCHTLTVLNYLPAFK